MPTKTNSKNMLSYNARGRWREIISELLPEFSEALKKIGKHVACPKHGGKDGFKFFPDFDITGGGICNSCCPEGKSNGFKLIAWAKDCSIKDAYAMVKKFLKDNPSHIKAQINRKAKSKRQNTNCESNLFKTIIKGCGEDSNQIVPKYFKNRGLDVPLPSTVKFHPKLQYFNEDGKSNGKFPAMVVPIDKNGKIIGLHVTYLAPDGSAKAPVNNPKKTIKRWPNTSLSGGSIVLADSDETGKLILTEGIETALACHQATGCPAWACGNTSLMKKVALPDYKSEIYIAADLDRSGAGLATAEKLAQRLLSEGKKVYIVIPPGPIPEDEKSQDWLDILITNGLDIVRNYFKEAKEILSEDLENKLEINSNELIKKYGLDSMDCSTSLEEIQRRMTLYVEATKSLPDLQKLFAKSHLIEILKEKNIPAPTQTANDLYEEEGQDGESLQGIEIQLDDPDPWPKAVDGAVLLKELILIYNRFLVLSPGASEIIALWTIFTWSIDAFTFSPNLLFQSPEKRCGKSTAISLLRHLCKRTLVSSNISSSSLFRSIAKYQPTLLIDEADRGLKHSPEINLIINAGHSKGLAFTIRNVGEDHDPRQFSTWCAKAIACIGKLEGTLEDRSIIIPMSRKRKTEVVERFKDKLILKKAKMLQQKMLRWVQDNFESLSSSSPSLPDSINDRAQDNWEPLLAIADVVGGEWPSKIRKIITTHFNGDEKESSFGVQLLEDINLMFKKLKKEKIPTVALLEKLVLNEDRPWGEFGRERKPLTPRRLSELLKPYGIRPARWKDKEDKTARGYRKTQFKEAWERYI